MALPIVQYPIFEIVIPSTKSKVKFRPFTVKEQKLLYQASIIDKESVLNLVIEIIKSCAIDKITVDSLKMFDIDYIFLALRARSVGELVPVNYVCRKKGEDGTECGTQLNLSLNLNAVRVEFPEIYHDKMNIAISDKIGMKLRFPSVKQLLDTGTREEHSVFTVSDRFIFNCIECIYDDNNVMTPEKDFTESELSVFLETLPATTISQLNVFFGQNPYVLLEQPIRCPKCGNEETVRLTEFANFFG